MVSLMSFYMSYKFGRVEMGAKNENSHN